MKVKNTHKGFAMFPDRQDMLKFDRNNVIVGYPRFDVEVKIFQQPDENYRRFLCDLPSWEEGWGGVFKCFLYPDNKFLGSWAYVKEANKPDEKVDGTYEYMDDQLVIKAIMLEDGNPVYGVYFELEQL